MNCPYCNHPVYIIPFVYTECQKCPYYPSMIDWSLAPEYLNPPTDNHFWVSFKFPKYKILFYPNERKTELLGYDHTHNDRLITLISFIAPENITPYNVQQHMDRLMNLMVFL